MGLSIRQFERKLGTEIRREQVRAANASIGYGLAEATRRSSGGISTRQQAKEDHPYAVRHGAPLRDPSIINEQTGVFKRGWEDDLATLSDTGSVARARLSNQTEVADYLNEGTRTMFRRPIADKLEESINERAMQEVKISEKRIENRMQNR